jgi:pimeloyl-ACP methyl ester carboxylesterase
MADAPANAARSAIVETEATTDFGPVRVLAAGEGAGPTVVLVHGYAASADQWRPLMTRLAGSGRLLAFDLLGFGAAPAPAPPYTVERWLAEVETLLELAGPSVVLVGHSLGGLIAAEAARRWPERVRALALLCPFGVLPPLFVFGTRGPARPLVDRVRHPSVTGVLFRGVRFFERVLAWPLAASAFHRPFDASASAVEAVAQWRWLITRPSAELALLDIAWRIEELETQLVPGEVTAPALVIWGQQDHLLPVSLAASWQERLPQADLVVLNRCGHLPHVERADDTAMLLETLLRRIADEPAPAAG